VERAPAPDSTTIVLQTYLSVLALLCLYGLHRVWMVARFRWRRRDDGARADARPFVTVQLPVYNERTVVARADPRIGALDYPRERLEIQVLDDSTDETRAIVDREVAELARADRRVTRRAPRRPRGLQGRRARSRSRTREGRADRDLRRRLHSRVRTFLLALVGTSAIPASAWCRRAGGTRTASRALAAHARAIRRCSTATS
jgi:cellulose synthase/poly-beta-1,6-N-acetylglucosamine synthase-like glycosyltransferase